MVRGTVLGAYSLQRSNSGIACVARLIAKVLSQVEEECSAITLYDSESSSDFAMPSKFCAGSKSRFVANINLASLSNSHFIYDSVGMARAHGRIPCINRASMVYVHGIEVWEGARRLNAAVRAEMLVANSEYTRSRADALHGIFRDARVCWLATETDDVPPLTKKLDGAPRVLIVGRLDQENYKGHDALIDCWDGVVDTVADAELHIVGTGPGLGALRKRVSASSVAEAIHIHGFVSDRALEEQWSRATVYAMPSRGEGFGLVYIEAMRHGIPVVASVHDAASEINKDGVTGFNIDMERPCELTERLIHLLKNRDEANALGQNGAFRWRDEFSFSAFRSRFVPILEEFEAI